MTTGPATIPAAVRRAEAEFGTRPAVRDGDGRWLTWAELAEGVRGAAAACLAHGVAPGDRVAVWAPNGVPWMLAALGAQYIGAALVPLNTRYRGEAADVLLRSGTRLLVVDQGFLGVDHLALLSSSPDERAGVETVVSVGDDVVGATSWQAFLGAAGAAERERAERLADAVTPETVADVLYTSGTTGRPKGAVAGHRQTLEVAAAWAGPAAVTENDVYLIMNPFFHSFGSKAGYLVCLLTGAACLPVPVFDVGAVLDLARSERVTILPGPPTLFTSLLEKPGAAGSLGSLRVAVTGAAIVPEALVVRMREELGIPVVLTAYGLTEAPVVTMSAATDDPHTVATTCGRAARNTEIMIRDGELLVRSPQVMTGYLDDPEATAAAVDTEGWLHTGDVATIDDAGHLRITDRIKDMFTVGGFNVYPAEVERVLAGHPEVLESAVVGAPDERLGEIPVGFVVPRQGCSPDPEALIAFCRANLANFKVPRRITLTAALPRNAGGKVVKADLRAR